MTAPEFVVYTDGASRKDGRGGWGFAIWYDETWWEECGGEHDTTNNRMELMGAIAGINHLHCLSEPDERLSIELWSDSRYVIDGITEYIDDWMFRNWRTSGNKPVKNVDLWKWLHELNQAHDIEWRWVKGHTGNEGNERADVLASRGIPTPRKQAPNPHAGRIPVRRRATGSPSTDAETDRSWQR